MRTGEEARLDDLFVAPYHYLSRALFYEAILRSEQPHGAQYYDAPTV